jgi:hypothetical protein
MVKRKSGKQDIVSIIFTSLQTGKQVVKSQRKKAQIKYNVGEL